MILVGIFECCVVWVNVSCILCVWFDNLGDVVMIMFVFYVFKVDQ